ncbi:MAG: hypothetical protein J6V83_04945 [Clostridia bacterium]|nr:hypothetical protein [Clostridia bacterium]
MGKSGRFFLLLFVVVMLVLMIITPQIYIEAAMEGLEIFTYSVLPVLLPFFIFTKLFSVLGGDSYLSKLLKPFVVKVFGAPPIAGSIMCLSMLSGYPIGAKMVAENRSRGLLTIEDSKRIIAFTSTSGPLFILGTIGVKFLNDYKAGVIILSVHLVSAIINGIIFKTTLKDHSTTAIQELTIPSDFYKQSIDSSINAILQVAASIVILNMLIVALGNLKVFPVVVKFLSILGIKPQIANGLTAGLIEITKGIKTLADSGLKIKDTIVPISVIVSFGGCSVAMQSMVFLRSCGIKTSYYFVTKLSQSVVSYILASLAVMVLY